VEDGKGWGRGLVGAARKLSIARAEYEAAVRHDEDLAAHLLYLAEVRRRWPTGQDRHGREIGRLTPPF
jgi:hypothetical protein